MRFLITAGLLLLAILPALHGQENRHGTYGVESFLPGDHGGGSQNWGALQDERGFIYVANGKGVLQYDGMHWRLIPLPAQRAAFSLGTGPDGRIWVGGHDDIGYLAPDSSGTLIHVSISHTLPDSLRPLGRVRKIVVYNQALFFRSHKYLLRWDGRRWMVWKPRTSYYRPFVVNGTFYIWEAKTGLLTLDGERLRLAPGGAFFVRHVPTAIMAHGKNSLLIATWDKGLFVKTGPRITPFPLFPPRQEPALQIIDAQITPQKTLAVLSNNNGLYIFNMRGVLLQHLTAGTGLTDEQGNHLFIDQGADIWLSNNTGINRIASGVPFTLLNKKNGYKGKIFDIIRHRDIFYLATSAGLYARPADGGKPFRLMENGKVAAWSFLKTDHGLLAATNNGVVEITDSRVRLLATGQSKTFYLLALMRNGKTVLAGTEDGLAEIRYINRRWQYRRKIDGIQNEVRSIVEEGPGRYWLGTYNAGYIQAAIEDGTARARYFSRENGILFPNERRVTRIKNDIFFYGPRGELKRYDPVRRMFYPDTTLFGRPVSVFRMAADSSGKLWVFRMENRRAVYEFGYRRNGRYHFTARAALKRLPLAAQSVYVENDSISWLGAGSALIRYNTKQPFSAPPVPAAQIRRVLFRDSLIHGGYKTASVPRLPYPNNAIGFEYALPVFQGRRALRFQYYLEGYEEGWSAWSPESGKNYTNLYEGEYRFHVRGMDAFGHTSPEAVYAFTIMPPLYRTTGAYIFYAFLFMLGLFVTDRARGLQIRRKAEKQAAEKLKQLEEINRAKSEARKQVRKKTSADFHDELGHVLTRLSLLTELARRSVTENPETQKYLRLIGSGIADLTTGVKDFIWMLDADKDTLYDTLIRIREFGDALFEYSPISFTAPGLPQNLEKIRIDMDTRRNMTLIFKEAMNNCLKYSGADQAAFSVRQKDGGLEVCFWDNGTGYTGDSASGGYGLKNMRQRAEKIGATLVLNSDKGKTGVLLTLGSLPGENTTDG